MDGVKAHTVSIESEEEQNFVEELLDIFPGTFLHATTHIYNRSVGLSVHLSHVISNNKNRYFLCSDDDEIRHGLQYV